MTVKELIEKLQNEFPLDSRVAIVEEYDDELEYGITSIKETDNGNTVEIRFD